MSCLCVFMVRQQIAGLLQTEVIHRPSVLYIYIVSSPELWVNIGMVTILSDPSSGYRETFSGHFAATLDYVKKYLHRWTV